MGMRIVTVAKKYAHLTHRGLYFVCDCPDTDCEDGVLFIFPNTQRFYCNKCKAQGNSEDLLLLHKRYGKSKGTVRRATSAEILTAGPDREPPVHVEESPGFSISAFDVDGVLGYAIDAQPSSSTHSYTLRGVIKEDCFAGIERAPIASAAIYDAPDDTVYICFDLEEYCTLLSLNINNVIWTHPDYLTDKGIQFLKEKYRTLYFCLSQEMTFDRIEQSLKVAFKMADDSNFMMVAFRCADNSWRFSTCDQYLSDFLSPKVTFPLQLSEILGLTVQYNHYLEVMPPSVYRWICLQGVARKFNLSAFELLQHTNNGRRESISHSPPPSVIVQLCSILFCFAGKVNHLLVSDSIQWVDDPYYRALYLIKQWIIEHGPDNLVGLGQLLLKELDSTVYTHLMELTSAEHFTERAMEFFMRNIELANKYALGEAVNTVLNANLFEGRIDIGSAKHLLLSESSACRH